MLIITHGPHGLVGESAFEVRDEVEETDDGRGYYSSVIVHPWHRYMRTEYESHQVFVSVGNYNADGTEYEEDEGEPVWSHIADREEFVQGLLAVFPELTRRDAT